MATPSPPTDSQVSLDAPSASALLWSVLKTASLEYKCLSEIPLATLPAFRKHYAQLLPRLELARVTSEERFKIATRLCELVQRQIVFQGKPLLQSLETSSEPYPLLTLRGLDTAAESFSLHGQRYAADGWCEAGEVLLASGKLNAEGMRSLRAGLATSERSLYGESFAVMGAAAELAPTRELLRRGARVLWVDRAAPRPEDLPARGQLLYAANGMNLLLEPSRVLATIRAFAGNEPVHVGCYAYAAGGAREWRLVATMNAIVEQLAPSLLQSISFLYSPASPNPISIEDADAAQAKRQRLSLVLGETSYLASDPASFVHAGVTNNVVTAQGASYQAAQYLGKRVWLESLIARYPKVACGATMAGISQTDSMGHPVFRLAFSMAPKLGVDIYNPAVSRQICALMMLGRLQGSASKEEPQLHGGVHRLPYSLGHALKRALLLAVTRHPRTAAALLAPRWSGSVRQQHL